MAPVFVQVSSGGIVELRIGIQAGGWWFLHPRMRTFSVGQQIRRVALTRRVHWASQRPLPGGWIIDLSGRNNNDIRIGQNW